VKLDGKHPLGSSHHQKMLVIDDSIAFCGGIDVTLDRWDTRLHLDDDPDRLRPNGRPYGPWHDASSLFTGPAARALGDLCRERWVRAGGDQIRPVTIATPLPETVRGFSFGAVDLAIARTSPSHQEETPIVEIERLYLDMIAAARHSIYAESQYFASRAIAQAIAKRLMEPEGPEVVLITPLASDNWLGVMAMDTARARLRESLRRHDRNGRFRIYHPITPKGLPIYVHSKLMVIDDEYIRVGSSNINNRSMRFDKECDVAFAACGSDRLKARIGGFRTELLAEHLGMSAEIVASTVLKQGSLIRAIEELRARDKVSAGITLVPYETPAMTEIETWLADNEILDPEGPEQVFEPIERRGLFKGRLRLPRLRQARD
jgi:phosphatidylserine/phosphatidylglycerophosphate/cardiolipin synthase-like enzyme